jgi:hypothetical protein
MKTDKLVAKRAALLLVGLLILGNISFSQSLTSGMWQLQNPKVPANSEVFTFNVNSSFFYLVTNMVTGLQSSYDGSYELSGNLLTLRLTNGGTVVYPFTWWDNDKFIIQNGNTTLYYGKIGTSEDKYFSNYLQYVNDNRPQACYSCHGSGRCAACNGRGYLSGVYGGTYNCSLCGGTGVCHECHGSGQH